MGMEPRMRVVRRAEVDHGDDLAALALVAP